MYGDVIGFCDNRELGLALSNSYSFTDRVRKSGTVTFELNDKRFTLFQKWVRRILDFFLKEKNLTYLEVEYYEEG